MQPLMQPLMQLTIRSLQFTVLGYRSAVRKLRWQVEDIGKVLESVVGTREWKR